MKSSPALAIACAVILLALAALAAPAEAKRIFIPQDHKSLQRGIDAAAAGDTIWVAAGTYAGPFKVTKRLVLFGDAGAENTILDGGDSARVLHIEGTKGGAVIGFTIQRGRANSGGGIHCVRDTSLVIAGCVFRKNWESAISIWASFDINMRELLLEENTGSAIALYYSAVLFRHCQFTKNSGYTGGAVSFVRSRMLAPFRECSFDSNRAEGATGGAINADSSEVMLVECDFRGNTAKIAGGALACMDSAKVTVSRCRFTENRAPGSGAIHVDTSGLNMGMTIFDRNYSTALGSAVGLLGRMQANINPIIQNCTFYKNAADNEGSTIWAEQVSPELRKNIFYVDRGQRAAHGVSTSPLYECNLVYDPTGVAAPPSRDTLVGDPLFCDPATGNFFLRDLSPAALAVCGNIGALPKKCSSFKLAPSK